jgi:hypothetical protein
VVAGVGVSSRVADDNSALGVRREIPVKEG